MQRWMNKDNVFVFSTLHFKPGTLGLARSFRVLRERGRSVSCQAVTLERATSAPLPLASHASITVSTCLFCFDVSFSG